MDLNFYFPYLVKFQFDVFNIFIIIIKFERERERERERELSSHIYLSI